jgi:hypothetical protein
MATFDRGDRGKIFVLKRRILRKFKLGLSTVKWTLKLLIHAPINVFYASHKVPPRI